MIMQREISAGLVIYRKTKQGIKYLLMYHGGGYWRFPKGKLELQERGMDAAFREVKEETGLGKSDLILKDQFRATEKFTYFRDKKQIFKIVILYLAQSRKTEITVSREHDGYGWFTYKEALKILKHENIKNIIRKANLLLIRANK